VRRDLQTILVRDNPWLTDSGQLGAWLRGHRPEPYIPRRVGRENRDRWTDPRRAHLVIGPRQAGKSSVLWAHLAELGQPALHVDCEQALVQSWCESAPLFLTDLDGLLDEPVVILFDEVQHLDEAGLFIKGLIDRKYPRPLLVTGSSSYHLGARTRESLAGRATRTTLLPLSLAEVSRDLEDRPALLRQRELEERLARHLVVGGYPDVWLSDDPAPVLTELVESFVLRDASDLFRIERPDALRGLLRLLARQVGSLVNLSEWASLLGISRDTVASYLAILEESHVVHAMRPFAGGKRSELTSRPKVFLIDPGLRNHLVGDLRAPDERTDMGPMLESWIFSELHKVLPRGHSIHFWRSTSGAEVDFVIAGPNGCRAVEVKAQRMKRPSLPRASRSFIEAYDPDRFVVVNRGLEHAETLGNTSILWTTPDRLTAALGIEEQGS